MAKTEASGTAAIGSDAGEEEEEQLSKSIVTREILRQRFLDAMAGMTMGLIFPLMILQTWGDIGRAAQVNGLIETVQALFRIAVLPMIVSLSDRVGRKPLLCSTAFISMMARGLIIQSQGKVALIVSKLLGVAGVIQRNVAKAALADLAGGDRQQLHDINAKEQSIMGLAMAISPVVGGTLGSRLGLVAPASLSASLYALSLGMARWRTPETLTVAKKNELNAQTARQAPHSILGFTTLFRQGWKVALLSLALFIGEITNSTTSIYSLFVKERFGWGPDMAGIWVTFFGLTLAAPGILTKMMIKRFGETHTVSLAFILHAVGTAMFALSRNSKLFWMGLLFMGPGNVKISALETVLQATLAETSDCGKGELVGHISSLKSLAAVIMPIMHAKLFTYFVSPRAPVYLPSIPWIVCTVSSLVSVSVFHMANSHKANAVELES